MKTNISCCLLPRGELEESLRQTALLLHATDIMARGASRQGRSLPIAQVAGGAHLTAAQTNDEKGKGCNHWRE
jgi:hypothetical protein